VSDHGRQPGGYRAWRNRPVSASQRKDLVVLAHFRDQFEQSLGSYGRPRMTEELKALGLAVGHRRVGRLMKENGIKVRRNKKFKATTDSNHSFNIAPNLLDRDFSAARPNRKWAGDISYVRTQEGWLYLAVILDLHSRRVIGWAVSNRMKRDLAIRALNMAIALRQPPKGCIHHTDRGSQGGLNRSSQRSETGGCNDDEETALGSGGTEEVIITRKTAGCDPRGSGGVLDRDCCRAIERGRRCGSGCIDACGIKVVPEVGRHATNASFSFGGTAVGTLPVFRGARGDCAASCPRPRRASHRQDSESRFVNDFARAAAQRGYSKRQPGIPCHDRTMAR